MNNPLRGSQDKMISMICNMQHDLITLENSQSKSRHEKWLFFFFLLKVQTYLTHFKQSVTFTFMPLALETTPRPFIRCVASPESSSSISSACGSSPILYQFFSNISFSKSCREGVIWKEGWTSWKHFFSLKTGLQHRLQLHYSLSNMFAYSVFLKK